MGRTTIYLLPDLQNLTPQDYAGRVKAVLGELGIIHDEPEADYPEFYPPGSQSLVPFGNEVGWEAGFETCIIYGDARTSVVPTDPAVDPRCPGCSLNVREVYYETINDAVEVEPERGDDELRVRCPGCGGEYRLDQLVEDVGIYLVNAYINFDDIPGSLRPEWLIEFDRRVGVNHRCLEYWYT